MEWYYADATDQQQSTSEESLPGLVAGGVIKPQTLLWNETLVNWKPAIEFRPDLFGTLVAPPILSPAQRREVGLGNSGLPGQTSPTDSVAVCALIFGLLGLFCFPLLGLGGVVCGHIARKRAREETLPSSNGGMALAGLITGYISLAIMIVILVFYAVVFIAAIAGAGIEGTNSL